jgi:hypothetical protein
MTKTKDHVPYEGRVSGFAGHRYFGIFRTVFGRQMLARPASGDKFTSHSRVIGNLDTAATAR